MSRCKKTQPRLQVVVSFFIEQGHAKGLQEICPFLNDDPTLLVNVLTTLATRPLVIHSQHQSLWTKVDGDRWEYTSWHENAFMVCTRTTLQYCEAHVWLKAAVDYLTQESFPTVESLQDLPCSLVNAFVTTESPSLYAWFVDYVLSPDVPDRAFWSNTNSFVPLLRTTEFLLLYYGDPVLLQNAIHRQTQGDLLAVQEKVTNMATAAMVNTDNLFFHRIENNQNDRVLMTFGWFFLCRMLALSKEYLTSDARFHMPTFRASLLTRIRCVFPFALQALQGKNMDWSFAQVRDKILNEQAAWKACQIAEEFRTFLLNPNEKTMQNRVVWALYDRTLHIRESMAVNDKVANTPAVEKSSVRVHMLTEEESLQKFVRHCLVERGQVEQVDVLDQWFLSRHGEHGPNMEVCKYGNPRAAFDVRSSDKEVEACLATWNYHYVVVRVPERQSVVQRTLLSFGLDSRKVFVGMTDKESFMVLRRKDLIKLQCNMVSNMSCHEGWWNTRVYPAVQRLVEQPHEKCNYDVNKMLIHYAASLFNVKKYNTKYASMAKEGTPEWETMTHFQTLCYLVSNGRKLLACQDEEQALAIRSFLMIRSVHYLTVSVLEEMYSMCNDDQMEQYIRVLYNNIRTIKTKQVTVYEDNEENELAASLSTSVSKKRLAEAIPKKKLVTVLTNPNERMQVEWCVSYGQQLGRGDLRISRQALTSMFYNWIFKCYYENQVDEKTLQRWLLNFTTDDGRSEKKKFGFAVPDPKNGPVLKWPPIVEHSNPRTNETAKQLAMLERSVVCGNNVFDIVEQQEEKKTNGRKEVWFTALITEQKFDHPESVAYFDMIHNCTAWFKLDACVDEKLRYASWINICKKDKTIPFVQAEKTPIKPAVTTPVMSRIES